MKFWTPHDSSLYRATIEHESAHLAMALHVRASVHEVEVRSPRTTRSYYGGVNVAALTAWADAAISLAGAVWTETHPTEGVPEQRQDINSARAHARDAGCEFDDLRRYVVAFLQHQDRNVRMLADRIGYALPQTGILKGLKLARVASDFAQRIPQLDHSQMRAWSAPMPAIRYASGRAIDEGAVEAV